MFSGFLYLASSLLFIFSLQGLSSAKTARFGSQCGMLGMLIAVSVTLYTPGMMGYTEIFIALSLGAIVGSAIALKMSMTSLPQLMAAFHSLVGLAAVFVATAALIHPILFGLGLPGMLGFGNLLEMSLGGAIGAMTFTGSLVAFGKLQGLIGGRPFVFQKQYLINVLLGVVLIGLICWFVQTESYTIFILMMFLSLILGVSLVMPIGGADMPVIVSMLNSYSGWAAAGIGFTLKSFLLIITGALVGSSGAILSYVMCRGMNRSFLSVLLGGFGTEATVNTTVQHRDCQSGSPEGGAFILQNAQSIIVVPGYGMAVAQAQHVLCDMTEILRQKGSKVRFAIHPVAGRMPGHMNVLLAEANIPYDDVLGLEDINHDFSATDVAFVIGANDVTNPLARTDPTSTIYGMPILDVEKAKTVLFVKRSLSPGYAGVDNALFYRQNTLMLFGDAKKVCEDIIKAC